MPNIFVVSDTHFNHQNILGFVDKDGKKFRGDRFKDVDEMNETMIENWNKVVTDQDKVYHLGDVYFGSQKDAKNILRRLKGKKRLIVGNHDCIYGDGNPLQEFFQKIYLWRIFKEFDMLLSHVPIHRESFRKVGYNVHGHIHEKESYGPEYVNVCVEKMNYTPVNIEEILL